MKPIRVDADFYGLFGNLLCLSHSDMCKGSRWVLKIDSNGVRHESEIMGED